MTWEQITEILGPELAENARAAGRASKPLTPAQVAFLAAIFTAAERRAVHPDPQPVIEEVA